MPFGGSFRQQKENGYKNVKNEDLIDRFLAAAEGFRLSSVKENGNDYSEEMRERRKQTKGLSIERDR